MKKMKNEFFDPATCPFEVLGFFESLDDVITGKPLGDRPAVLDRAPGAASRKEYLLTKTISLNKGHRIVELKASPKRPRRVFGTLQILCGKLKGKQNENRER